VNVRPQNPGPGTVFFFGFTSQSSMSSCALALGAAFGGGFTAGDVDADDAPS
jgi:hypothetical protein